MKTYEEAIEYIKEHKCLPDGFDQWELTGGKNGWTVAHAAATNGCLPKDFTQWDLANDKGWTVAHAAACCGNLPKGFNQWKLRTRGGKTVAHFAATCKHLPEDFSQWHLADNDNKTVFETMVHYYNSIPKWFKDWNLVITDDGETCKEVYGRIKEWVFLERCLAHDEG